MIKRILCYMMMFSIFLFFISSSIYALNHESAKDAIDDANKFLESKMGN